jgi:secreted trypsin-like serine protease
VKKIFFSKLIESNLIIGDSGGPIQIQNDVFKIIGVTSFGIGTCGSDVPGNYIFSCSLKKLFITYFLFFMKEFTHEFMNI